MTKLITNLHAQAAPVMPFTTRRVQVEMHTFAHKLGAYIDKGAAKADRRLEGTIVMPIADLVLAGTSCLKIEMTEECEALAAITHHDVVLLRHDAVRGTTFDVFLQSTGYWMTGRLAWQRDGDLWLVPEVGFANCIRVTAAGLICEGVGPFRDLEDRSAGIRLTLKVPLAIMPAFLGSC
jgi:hypothetical protein